MYKNNELAPTAVRPTAMGRTAALLHVLALGLYPFTAILAMLATIFQAFSRALMAMLLQSLATILHPLALILEPFPAVLSVLAVLFQALATVLATLA